MRPCEYLAACIWCSVLLRPLVRRRPRPRRRRRPRAMADAPSPQVAMEDTLASVQRALALLHHLQCSVSAFHLPSQLVLLDRLCVPPPVFQTRVSLYSLFPCFLFIPVLLFTWWKLAGTDWSLSSEICTQRPKIATFRSLWKF